MKFNKITIVLCVVLILTGCAKEGVKTGGGDNTSTVVDPNSSVDSAGFNAEGSQITEMELDKQLSRVNNLMQTSEFSDLNSPLSKRTIYFDYDSSQVAKEFIPILEAHAHYLIANPNQRITLEGYSDERGTREYNIALGEQRAKAVFKMLQLIGVMGGQMDIVSYGEEKPAELGRTEQAYAMNRRVILVYK